MPSPSLPIALQPPTDRLAAVWRQLRTWSAALQRMRMRRAQARWRWKAERELQAMSLHGLRDIGAPDTLLASRQRNDDRLRQLQRYDY